MLVNMFLLLGENQMVLSQNDSRVLEKPTFVLSQLSTIRPDSEDHLLLRLVVSPTEKAGRKIHALSTRCEIIWRAICHFSASQMGKLGNCNTSSYIFVMPNRPPRFKRGRMQTTRDAIGNGGPVPALSVS